MTVIEVRALETIVRGIPKIANELKRIADALEAKKEVEDGRADS